METGIRRAKRSAGGLIVIASGLTKKLDTRPFLTGLLEAGLTYNQIDCFFCSERLFLRVFSTIEILHETLEIWIFSDLQTAVPFRFVWLPSVVLHCVARGQIIAPEASCTLQVSI